MRVIKTLICAECGDEFQAVGFTDITPNNPICHNCQAKKRRQAAARNRQIWADASDQERQDITDDMMRWSD